MSECLHPLGFSQALLWAIVGSVASWGVVVVGPWARRAFEEVREGKLRLSFNPHMLLPAFGVLIQLSALGLIGAAVGDPSTWRDGVVWGLGAQSLAAGLLGKFGPQH
jgi:hypothetical protein